MKQIITGKLDAEKPETIISMPREYWESTANYWKIKPEWIKSAAGRDNVIARMPDGTKLVIGNESNKR